MKDRQDRPEWSTGAGPSDTDRIFQVLAHPSRRFVLEYLRDPGGVATVSELAAAMSAARGETASLGGVPRGIAAFESALYHVHFPMLADAELVTYEPDEGTVSVTTRVESVYPILDAAAENL